MFTKIRFNKYRLQLLVALGIISFVLSVATVVLANSPFDIEFPIPELNNCVDKTACKSYCDNQANAVACQIFAEKHGLGGTAKNEKNIDEFLKALETNGGPDGQCGRVANPVKACETVCNQQENMKPCLEYAIKNNLLPGKERAEAEKVLLALQRGIKLPPACQDGKTCKATCENPPDAEAAKQCFTFAKEAGLLPPEFDDARAEKMIKLMDRGDINFKDMRKCEALDRGGDVDEKIVDNCLKVGVELGFMKESEKEFARRMMLEGGPGGCRGKACKDFCDQENNQDTCVEFFESHGGLPAEAKEQMSRGLEQMKQSLNQAPPEVAQCLRESLPDIFQKIDSAEGIKASEMRNIGVKIGPAMQACFQKNMHSGSEDFPDVPNQGGSLFPGKPGEFPLPGRPGTGSMGQSFSPQVQSCLSNKGINLQELKGAPPADLQNQIQSCFKEASGERKEESEDALKQKPPEQFQRPEGFSPDRQSRQGVPEGFSPDQFKQEFNQQNRQEFQKQTQQRPPEDQNYQPGNYQQYPTDGEQFGPQQNNSYPSGYPTPNQYQYPSGGDQNYQPGAQEYRPSEPAPQQPIPGPESSQPQSRLNPPSFGTFFAQILIGFAR